MLTRHTERQCHESLVLTPVPMCHDYLDAEYSQAPLSGFSRNR